MHGRLPDSIMHSDRIKAASVRNPWDWYVSVWAYGCDGKGVLFDKLAEPRKLLGHGYRMSLVTGVSNLLYELCRSRRIWRETYADSSSPVLFRRWLGALLDPETSRELGEAYSKSSLSRFAGFYTYRYCHLFHRTIEHLYDGTIHDQGTLLETDRRLNIVQHMLRMEKLTDGILELLENAGIDIDTETRQSILDMKPTNPSSRKRSLSFYYDEATSDLVGNRDALIVDKYGYKPPEIETV
ncbi:MAG: hypothetical protein ABFR50_00425 [Candidatus Fermentibacteria bacterium]